MQLPFPLINAGLCVLLQMALCIGTAPAPHRRDSSFEKIDKNEDGKLSRVELKWFIQPTLDELAARNPEWRQTGLELDKLKAAAHDYEQKFPLLEGLVNALDCADSDGDGWISLDEYGDSMVALTVEKADADQDGFISRLEDDQYELAIEAF